MAKTPICVLCGKPGTQVHVTTEDYAGPVHIKCWGGREGKKMAEVKQQREPVPVDDEPQAAGQPAEQPQSVPSGPAEETDGKTECPTCGKRFKNLKRHHCKEGPPADGPIIEANVEAPNVPQDEEHEPMDMAMPKARAPKPAGALSPCPPGSTEVVIPVPSWVREKYPEMPETVRAHIAIDWGIPSGPVSMSAEVEEEDFVPEDALEVK